MSKGIRIANFFPHNFFTFAHHLVLLYPKRLLVAIHREDTGIKIPTLADTIASNKGRYYGAGGRTRLKVRVELQQADTGSLL